MTILPHEKPDTGPARHDLRVLPATFGSLGVPVPLVAALAAADITAPFPIQAVTLPDALAGHDILGQGRTGSGKTLAYSLPLVARLADGFTMACRPRGLVLLPTRELASQVEEVLQPLALAMGLSVTAVFGGTAQRSQVAALRDRADIVVACPGRLADLIEQGHCHLGDVEVTVLDEADHMADLGFLPVVRRLLEATPPEGQRMLFSATLDSAVNVLVRRFLSEPSQHAVDSAAPPTQISHHLLTVSPEDRLAVVCALAGGRNRRWSSPGPSTARASSPGTWPRREYQPPNCTATCRKAPAPGTWRRSPPARSVSWSRPTSPRAASMSTASA